jgi:hypothetical protein
MSLPKCNHPWVDNSKSPIFIINWPSKPSTSELHGLFDAFQVWYESIRAPVAWVSNLDSIGLSQASDRQLLADREKTLHPFMRTYLKGIAFVAGSTMHRGIITAVYWLSKPPYAYTIVPSVTEGMKWAQQKVIGIT